MDYFKIQDFFRELNPNKLIIYEFDEKCHRVVELVHTDGNPNQFHHIECNKVKVTVENQKPVYVSIDPHRMVASWKDVKSMLDKKSDVNIHEGDLKVLADAVKSNSPEKDVILQQLVDQTGLSKDRVLAKISV